MKCREDGGTRNTQPTQRLVRLTKPWRDSNRIVFGDAVFSSVESAEELGSYGLRYIGMVKQAHMGFPKEALESVVLNEKGQWLTWTSKLPEATRPHIVGGVYADRARHYFIATASDTQPGELV